ncbi:hypothetical protein AHAS_Ahas14G0248700 [Arachis hypogaea]
MPLWLGRFENLVSLELSSNLLYGSVPYALRNLTSLTHLSLSNNTLISLLLWLGELKSLVYLVLSENNFTSVEDDFLSSTLSNLCHLEVFDLSESNCQGFAFKNKGTLSSCNSYALEYMSLSDNEFVGLFSSWLGQFKNLKYLDLRMRRNFLHGGIPSSFCKVAALQILDLAENNLVGPIPHCVGNITGMISAYNSLSLGESSGWGNEVVKQVIKGSELDYIRNLKYVVNLDLSNNFLSGSIPAEISSLSRLIGLNLSFNDFFGEIPKMIGDMKSLESIDLSHNHLSFWYYSKEYD